MTDRTSTARLLDRIVPAALSILIYLAAYLVLDAPRFSFEIRPGIATWSLPAALSLTLLVVRGPGYAPAVLLADFLSSGWSGLPGATWTLRLGSALAPALGYAGAAWLLSEGGRPGRRETTVRGIVGWLGVVAVSAGAVSAARTGLLFAAGELGARSWTTILMAGWMGEGLGIVSVLPFLLTVVPSDWPESLTVEWGRAAVVLAEIGGLVASLLLVFTPRPDEELTLLYPLFLPMLWITVHHGFRGAVVSNLGLVAGSMVLYQINGLEGIDALELQAFLLTLTVGGVLLGSALSDERQTRGRLRLQQTQFLVVERRREVAEAMREILAMINSERPLHEILDAIAEQAADLLRSETVAIFLLDPEAQALSVASSRGFPAAFDTDVKIPLGAGAVGKAVLERRPVILHDLEQLTVEAESDPTLVGDRARAAWLAGEFSTILSVPLLARQRAMGGMSLYYKSPREISDEERELAVSFATQAALALDNARLHVQAQELAVLQERQRLARELHDSVSQALYGISLGARTARALWDRRRGDLNEPLEYIQSLADAGLAEMRALIFELRPESLEREGLIAVLDRLSRAVAGRHDLELQTEFGPEPDVPMNVKEAFYRIAQEALNNTSKHARARRIEVALQERAGELELVVQDDGGGFDPEAEFPGHLGLRSMRERAERVGAELSIRSSPDRGTRVQVQWPMDGTV